MTRDWLMQAPPGTLVRVEEVKPLIKHADELADDAVLTTGQAHRHWPAYSAKTWRTWADQGLIRDAWKDDPDGPWRLPARSCAEQIARQQQQGRRCNGKAAVLRGPWKSKAAR